MRPRDKRPAPDFKLSWALIDEADRVWALLTSAEPETVRGDLLSCARNLIVSSHKGKNLRGIPFLSQVGKEFSAEASVDRIVEWTKSTHIRFSQILNCLDSSLSVETAYVYRSDLLQVGLLLFHEPGGYQVGLGEITLFCYQAEYGRFKFAYSSSRDINRHFKKLFKDLCSL